jgi:hypothetical protein
MKNLTEKDIKKAERRITKIWDEISPQIAGTGIGDLIEELIELEIQLSSLDGQ